MRSSGSTGVDWHDRFQEAALEPARWLSVLQELADATGSARAELVGFGSDLASFNWVTSTDERILADFLSVGGGSPNVNFRVAADIGTTPLQVIHETSYDAARGTLKRDDYLDFCEDHQMVFGCQTCLIRGDDALVGLSILRSRSDGRTSEGERAIFAEAARAALTAVRMQVAIERQGFHLLAGTLEAMSLSCLLLDGLGRACQVTPAAERLLATHPVLKLEGRRLSSSDGETRRRLGAALASILGVERRAHARVPLFGEERIPQLVLDVFRLPDREWATHFAPKAVLVLRDRRVDARGVELLIAAYDLTPAEAQVALALSSGVSREAIAASRRVSPETLRAQVKSLYQKTGCGRETELALLVSAFVGAA